MDCFPILTLSLGLLDCCIHRLFPILTLSLGLLYSWTVSQYLPCHWACWIVVFIDNFQYLPCHWACWIAVFIDCFPTQTCYWARLISVFVDCFPIHICHWSCWTAVFIDCFLKHTCHWACWTAVFIDCLPMHTRHWACWIAIFIDCFPVLNLSLGVLDCSVTLCLWMLQVRTPGGSLATNMTMATSLQKAGTSMTHCSTMPARLGEDNSGLEGDNTGAEETIQDRGQTRSPVNFREGRRASDGLVAQGIIAFRQRLRECMRARGMVELRQEHHQLQTLFASCHNNYNVHNISPPPSEGDENVSPPLSSSSSHPPQTASPPRPPLHPHRKLSAPHHGVRQWSLDEAGGGAMLSSGGGAVGRRRPLMKRMSLPSESFDIQPHRLLALKQSLFLEQQLDRVGVSPGAGSQEDVLPLAPPSHPHPPQAPPLPCSMATPPYEYAACSKTLQQQLMSHRLQQKRQVFQKHSLPHQHAPHPHPPHSQPHNTHHLPLPQQLSCQLQQLQIDPNNLPRIDFGPGYLVPPGNPFSQSCSADNSQLSTGCTPQSSYPTPGYSTASITPPPGATADEEELPPHLSSAYAYSSPTTMPATTSAADTFLEQIGIGGDCDCTQDSGSEAAPLNLNKSFGEGEPKEDKATMEAPTTPTHQWQRRAGVFMAVHPFQDSNALNLSISPAANAVFQHGQVVSTTPPDNSAPAFSPQIDSLAAVASQAELQSGFSSLSGPQSDKPTIFSQSLLGSDPSPNDNTKSFLHMLHYGHDSADEPQSLLGLESSMGAVNLVGYASQHMEPGLHCGNSSLLFAGGDAPADVQPDALGTTLTNTGSGSGQLTVSEPTEEHMDIS